MVEPSFPDHFSRQADTYPLYRPGYPDELFDYLATRVKQHNRAWDCATGSGQAAVQLASHFSGVIATDASQAQINHALAHDKVEYQVCPAEQTSIETGSIDLVTVAQALHWFNLDKFYQEVRRVLTPNGVIAVWTYNLLQVTPEIDHLIQQLYADTLGDYWPFERQYIENGYADLAFPFQPYEAPPFAMTSSWSLDHLLGYLSTWSAVQRYKAEHKHDPIAELAPQLKQAWGEADMLTVVWPLSVLVGH